MVRLHHANTPVISTPGPLLTPRLFSKTCVYRGIRFFLICSKAEILNGLVNVIFVGTHSADGFGDHFCGKRLAGETLNWALF